MCTVKNPACPGAQARKRNRCRCSGARGQARPSSRSTRPRLCSAVCQRPRNPKPATRIPKPETLTSSPESMYITPRKQDPKLKSGSWKPEMVAPMKRKHCRKRNPETLIPGHNDVLHESILPWTPIYVPESQVRGWGLGAMFGGSGFGCRGPGLFFMSRCGCWDVGFRRRGLGLGAWVWG